MGGRTNGKALPGPGSAEARGEALRSAHRRRAPVPDDLTVLREWMRAIIADVEAKLERAGYAADARRLYKADLGMWHVDHELSAHRSVLGESYDNEHHRAARAAATAHRLVEILESPVPDLVSVFIAGRELIEYDQILGRARGRAEGGRVRAQGKAADHADQCAADRKEYRCRLVERFRGAGWVIDRVTDLDAASEAVVSAMAIESNIKAPAMKDRIGGVGGMRAVKREAQDEIERRRAELLGNRTGKSPATGALAVEPDGQ